MMQLFRGSSGSSSEMALTLILAIAALFGRASGTTRSGEMVLANVTRFANGDLFSLLGSDCGPTRCMEISHGTALSAMAAEEACVCQCRSETPTFREDQKICVNHIDECPMATFGRGAKKPQIPFVYLPMKGQIIYPSKEIVFTDVEDAICAVTSAQYLSTSGWVTLRDLLDNDVPFSLYRDEGSTFLQWRGSPALHSRLEGRLVAAHVLCSAPAPTRLAASCAAFRVSGSSHNAQLDVHSISFHAGEVVTTEPASQNQGLSVLESLAIGVCVLMLIFVYAAGIIFYIHYKQRQKRKQKDPEMNNTLTSENESSLESRLDMDNVVMKTNPLLKIEGLGGLGADFLNDAGLSDVSERTEDTLDSSPSNSSTQKFQKLNSNIISAMVHTRRKKPVRPSIRAVSSPERVMERMQRRSASPEIERAPHSELSIVDYSAEKDYDNRQSSPANGEQTIRRKLYFNPVFFETEHLKNPPPAAIEFLIKIREVMSIAKEKMTSKRFIPSLSDIPEEESYHSVDLGWDVPCARQGRRFSVISLKRENSRRCSGCPGCNSREPVPNPALTRSNSCKTCVSEDYRQKIVRKWLDQVPSPALRNSGAKVVKAIEKVNGKSKSIDMKQNGFIASSPDLPRASTPELAFTSDSSPEMRRAKSRVSRRVSSPEPERLSSPEPGRVVSPKSRRMISPESRRDFPPEPKRFVAAEVRRTIRSPVPFIRANSPELTRVSSPELTPKTKRVRSPEPKRIQSQGPKRVRSPESRRVTSPEPSRIKLQAQSDEENQIKTFKSIETVIKDAMGLKDLSSYKDKKIDKPKLSQKTKINGLEKPTIIHHVPLDQENNNLITTSEIPFKTNIASEDTVPPKIPAKPTEKISPSNHASRKIRKRLPPPPPPPTVPPKPIMPNLIVSEIPKLSFGEDIKSIISESEPESPKEDEPPIPPEIKLKMEAVIKELSKCRRVEPNDLKTEEIETETIEPIPPKIVIPVVAADTHYFSDDNLLSDRKKNVFIQREPFVDMDSLERSMLKRRRFSLACGPELAYKAELSPRQDLQTIRDTLTRSWRDVRKADIYQFAPSREKPLPLSRSFPVSEVFINTSEPLYDNISKPGPLTIQVRGSPIETRRSQEEFDPDTLDRKPKREGKKRVEKILLKSGGSFKHKPIPHECGIKQVTRNSPVFTRKIGSLREIYEAKAKEEERRQVSINHYVRRGSLPYINHELSSMVKTVKPSEIIRRFENQKDIIKPPIAPKQKRGSDLSPNFMRDSPTGERRRSPEERERYQQYLRGENLKRSGRRSNRTRSRRTDIRKFYRTEDSGYLSTDSNESKRRASYLMQLRPKVLPEQTQIPTGPTIVKTPILQHVESDTDDMESICDGRSESGGESIETDSVFFGNFDESKQMLADLGMTPYEVNQKLGHLHEQIDSGFMGETNIILSGDSDSEHRSVISIVTGRDGRASAASITHLSDDPYTQSVEC